MMPTEQRFQGAMSEEYRLIRLTISHYEELQACVGAVVSRYMPHAEHRVIQLLEIGCGDGATSATILSSRNDCFLTALDSEETMIEQASANLQAFLKDNRCRLVLCDALTYLRNLPSESVDVVASALALHNMERSYRDALHGEVYRSLRPGGLFVNADKFAAGEEQRFEALQASLEKMFDVLVPLGKLELLRECVLHNVADQAPERVMREDETVATLLGLGFANVAIPYRDGVQAVLVASKSEKSSTATERFGQAD
jgi:ubiquinone/menaquinone biosynthesis C-methylase UbiE